MLVVGLSSKKVGGPRLYEAKLRSIVCIDAVYPAELVIDSTVGSLSIILFKNTNCSNVVIASYDLYIILAS